MIYKVDDERDFEYVGGFFRGLGFSVEEKQQMPNGKIHFSVPGFNGKKVPHEKQGIWGEMPVWVVGN